MPEVETVDIHRIGGGGGVENLRLKPREATLHPPGISVLKAPSPGWGDRLQHRESGEALRGRHRYTRAVIMKTKAVKIIDECGKVVATAQVARRGDRFSGRIDLDLMPASLRQQFEEYEEIVNGQVFSLLDEVEDQIGALGLKVLLEDGSGTAVGTCRFTRAQDGCRSRS
jgi:hypothetical protein